MINPVLTDPFNVKMRKYISENQLTKKSNVIGWRFVINFSIYVILAISAFQLSNLLVWFFFYMYGILFLQSCFAVMHEIVHNNFFMNRKINNFFGFFVAALIFVPMSSYKPLHFQHHKFTNMEKDSEPYVNVKSKLEYILIVLFGGISFLAIYWFEWFKNLFNFKPSKTKTLQSPKSAFLNALFVISVIFLLLNFIDFMTLLQLWILPACLAVFLSFIIGLPEHANVLENEKDIYKNTRTIKSNFVIRYFFCNANYHTAHHLVPTVPGNKLHLLQSFIDPKCEIFNKSYTNFHIELVKSL